ncbi:MAG TPA: M15 family metallopeptidase [Actinomycetota bacterium]|nr:M15 family metallopeptidase [Actinomycetota bacterium]
MSRLVDLRNREKPLPRRWLAVALATAAVVIFTLGLVVQRALRGEPSAVQPQGPAVSGARDFLPACTVGDARTRFRSYEDWDRTLLDTRLRLPATYEPSDLISTRKAGFETATPIRRLLVEDLAALRAAAEAAGNPVDVTWGYRSFRTQRWVFEYWSKRKGRDATLRTAARPGHSEHQLGTAVDFKSEGALNVDAGWRYEPAGVWMRENAWRFGFVESYPLGKESVTCYAHEPWHYRYFGRKLAAEIQASGLTTREYLWREANG